MPQDMTISRKFILKLCQTAHILCQKFRNVLSIVTFWQQTKYTKRIFRLNKEVEKCRLSSINTRLQFWNDIWFTLPIQLF